MTNDKAIVDFIKSFVRANGFSPNISEIQRGCDLSRGAVTYWLNVLESNGLIYRHKHQHRGIEIYSAPFPCLVRDYDSFGVVMLIHSRDTTDLIPDEWLVRGVSEAEARAVLEKAK